MKSIEDLLLPPSILPVATGGPSVVDLSFAGLGVDGLFLAMSCSVAAWVSIYDSTAARTDGGINEPDAGLGARAISRGEELDADQAMEAMGGWR
ncbi:hypothetical protein KBY66_08905 [Synechococcus sp. Tobar12-5m-g]|uniref:hypothetical protein n=1 Tax=unclassified Synechococcus TaxID=2626047 RepID=UPI0020CD844F|nr:MULTISPECIES: hypothetical protein [unclassified Synechococcus]MCP9772743.1 hypothetical protein [Synechococcus sp. Tobar12-5m-g]MCP9873620.1 hypothetical protein [Synechococcus sp. Cruz CV-v-12]